MNVKFKPYFLQICFKKHFEFAVLWRLVPGNWCIAVFIDKNTKKIQNCEICSSHCTSASSAGVVM